MKKLLQNSRKWLIPLIFIGLLTGLIYSISHKDQAPDVKFTTIDGKQSSFADLHGKVVLVNFWATSCPGCVQEMPNIVNTHKTYHNKGFDVVAVAMPYDEIDQIKNFSQKNGLPFMVTQDTSSEISEKFGQVRVTPTSFILDKQGHIIQKVIGELDFNALNKTLDAELAKAM